MKKLKLTKTDEQRLHLNDVLDFFVGIDYRKMVDHLKKYTPVSEHLIVKLDVACRDAKMLSVEVVMYWILAMDKKHRDIIQDYILKNHKQE